MTGFWAAAGTGIATATRLPRYARNDRCRVVSRFRGKDGGDVPHNYWRVHRRHRIKYGAGPNPLPSRARGSFDRLRTNGGGRDGPDFGPRRGTGLLRRRDCHAAMILAMTGGGWFPAFAGKTGGDAPHNYWGVYPRHRIKYGAGSNPLPSRARGSFDRLRTNGGGRDGPDFGPRRGTGLLRRRDCHAAMILAMTWGGWFPAFAGKTGGDAPHNYWGVYPRHRIKYGAGSNPLPSRARGSFDRLRTNGGGRDG